MYLGVGAAILPNNLAVVVYAITMGPHGIGEGDGEKVSPVFKKAIGLEVLGILETTHHLPLLIDSKRPGRHCMRRRDCREISRVENVTSRSCEVTPVLSDDLSITIYA